MKRIYLLIFLALAACSTKDDALYAPWSANHTNDYDSSDIDDNVSKIINSQTVDLSHENELCVTELQYPYKQACTKEVNL